MTGQTKPLKPTPRTYNRLFAKSGNRCAFPRCPNSITAEDSLVGEAAHIKAEKPGGARYDAQQTDEERRSFENLILLCANHHKVVDDDEEAYTVERLVKMKQAHETSATEVLESGNLSRAVELLVAADLAVTLINPQNSITAAVYNGVVNHHYSEKQLAAEAPRLGLKAANGKGRFRAAGQALGRQRLFNPFGNPEGPEVFLQDGACFWVRLFPMTAPEADWTIQDLKTAIGHSLLQETVHGYAEASLVAPDGIGTYPMIGKETYAVSFLSRYGEIWSIDTALLCGPEQSLFALTEVRNRLPTMLSNFAQALMNLGSAPPYKWVIGLEGVEGRGLSYELEHGYVLAYPRLIVDEVIVEGVYAAAKDIGDAVDRFTKRLFGECARPVPDGLI